MPEAWEDECAALLANLEAREARLRRRAAEELWWAGVWAGWAVLMAVDLFCAEVPSWLIFVWGGGVLAGAGRSFEQARRARRWAWMAAWVVFAVVIVATLAFEAAGVDGRLSG